MITPVRITDIIYGSTEITEPVLIELLASKPVQRLKHINQHGPMKQAQPQRGTITRYDHSVGVMLLLRKHGASVAEQAAGLLHDIAHTAFSHVVDYAMDSDKRQNFHEEIKQYFVNQSEIPEILRRYDFNPEYIIQAENFSLLERTEPELCADRIDYVVRDSVVTFDLLTLAAGKAHHAALRTNGTEWYFVNQQSAKQFAEDMLNCSEQGWYSATNLAAFHTLGTVMKLLLKNNFITQEDLFSTDEAFYAKCQSCQDSEIQQLLHQLENLNATVDPSDFTILRKPKIRTADPLFLQEQHLVRLSDADAAFHQRLEEHMNWLAAGIPVKILAA